MIFDKVATKAHYKILRDDIVVDEEGRLRCKLCGHLLYINRRTVVTECTCLNAECTSHRVLREIRR